MANLVPKKNWLGSQNQDPKYDCDGLNTQTWYHKTVNTTNMYAGSYLGNFKYVTNSSGDCWPKYMFRPAQILLNIVHTSQHFFNIYDDTTGVSRQYYKSLPLSKKLMILVVVAIVIKWFPDQLYTWQICKCQHYYYYFTFLRCYLNMVNPKVYPRGTC